MSRRRSIPGDLLLCARGPGLMDPSGAPGYLTITGLVCPHKIKTLLSSPLYLAPASETYDNLKSPCKIYTVFDNCPPVPRAIFTRGR